MHHAVAREVGEPRQDLPRDGARLRLRERPARQQPLLEVPALRGPNRFTEPQHRVALQSRNTASARRARVGGAATLQMERTVQKECESLRAPRVTPRVTPRPAPPRARIGPPRPPLPPLSPPSPTTLFAFPTGVPQPC